MKRTVFAPLFFATATLVTAGCTSDSPAPEEEKVVVEQYAPPIDHIEACNEPHVNMKVNTLDDGNAIEFSLIQLDGKAELNCLLGRLGISEASWSKGSVGDTLTGDGYTLTVTSKSGTAIIERIG